jgi:hypothetical protein
MEAQGRRLRPCSYAVFAIVVFAIVVFAIIVLAIFVFTTVGFAIILFAISGLTDRHHALVSKV